MKNFLKIGRFSEGQRREHIPAFCDYILGKDEVTGSSPVSSSRISTLSEGAFFLVRVLTKDTCAIKGDPEISADILGRRSILGVTDRAKQRATLSDG